jgi:hypothetical protein
MHPEPRRAAGYRAMLPTSINSHRRTMSPASVPWFKQYVWASELTLEARVNKREH